VATLFGFVYAGVMPLYAVLVRGNFPLRMMGTIIGGTTMAGSLGMATARWLEVDLRHIRRLPRLYLGAAALGICAFVIASTFKPYAPSRPRSRHAPEWPSDRSRASMR